MSIETQIEEYLNSQSEPKRSELIELNNFILQIMPNCKLWFLDGKDAHGKTIANPNIGYGSFNITYKNGRLKEFYKIGISGNTTGISIYVMNTVNKEYLKNTYAKIIGKASISGYCIKFKKLNDINKKVLETLINEAFKP